MSQQITVHKRDHHGKLVWQYTGRLLSRNKHTIVIEAYFNRDDYPTPYHTFKYRDRFVEWFYNNRWYNIFAMHHRDTGVLEGWYCNITRPAQFEADTIYTDDLALDMMVYLDGRWLVLDEDEFAALDIDSATRQQARSALQNLRSLVETRWGPFAKIQI